MSDDEYVSNLETSTGAIVLDDLDTWLGELHNSTHMWLLNLGESRETDHAAMMNAEQHVRDMVYQLRADVKRIGHERDQMVAANVELQQRLTSTIEVLEC